MNQIKIIKRANLQSPSEANKTTAEQASPALDQRQAVKVMAGWIDEWRISKPKDARRAFADLFNVHRSATV